MADVVIARPREDTFVCIIKRWLAVGDSFQWSPVLIIGLLDDLMLQPDEGFAAFAVKKRHVDVEQSQETVRHVFSASSLAH